MTAAERYRDVALSSNVLAATGPALTAIVYRELADTLRLALSPARLFAAGARALTLIADLDAQTAGDASFAARMRAIHRHASVEITDAIRQNDPKRIQAAIDAIDPIAEAWESLRSRP